MTKRPLRRARHSRAVVPTRELHRDQFPAASNFFKGYLHEDFPKLHGSIGAAVAAFCADANPDERRQLAQELETLVTSGTGRSMRDLRRFVSGDLGSRWEPKSREELTKLLQLIRASV